MTPDPIITRDEMLELFHYRVCDMTPKQKGDAARHQRKMHGLTFTRITGRHGNFYLLNEVKSAIEKGSTIHKAAA